MINHGRRRRPCIRTGSRTRITRTHTCTALPRPPAIRRRSCTVNPWDTCVVLDNDQMMIYEAMVEATRQLPCETLCRAVPADETSVALSPHAPRHGPAVRPPAAARRPDWLVAALTRLSVLLTDTGPPVDTVWRCMHGRIRTLSLAVWPAAGSSRRWR